MDCFAVMDKMKELDVKFEAWLQQFENLCHVAVYREYKGLMESLLQNLVQKVEEISSIRRDMLSHLNKLSKQSREVATSMSLSGNTFPSGIFVPLSAHEPMPMDFFIPSPKDYFLDYDNDKNTLLEITTHCHDKKASVAGVETSSSFINNDPKTLPTNPIKDPQPKDPQPKDLQTKDLQPVSVPAAPPISAPVTTPKPVASSVSPTVKVVPVVEPKKKEDAVPKDGEWSTVTRKPKHKKEKIIDKAVPVEKLTEKPSVPGKNGSLSISDRCASDETLETVDTKRIFLMQANRDRELDSVTVAKYFERYGPLVDVRIFRNPDGTSRGCASVEFAKEKSVQDALSEMSHFVDGMEVHLKTFYNSREGPVRLSRYHIFLGGVPTFMDEKEVKAAVEKHVKVRHVKLHGDRGYGLLELANAADSAKLLQLHFIKIGEKNGGMSQRFRSDEQPRLNT